MVAATPGQLALRELEGQREAWYAHVRQPMQLPEPGLLLDLASSRGSETRVLMHLQQISLLHHGNYLLSNRIRHLFLVDAFHSLAKAENPLALYAIARSMFELSAFLHQVQKRLHETSVALTEKNWQPIGEKFFAVLVRARFATTNPEFHKLFRSEGVPAARLKPFNITTCVSDLASEPGHEDARVRYDVLTAW